MRKPLVVLTVLVGLLVCTHAAAVVKPGSIPPDYVGKTQAGKSVHLSALRGDVVVVSFWATWCHYCLKELPILAGLQSVATRRGLHMQVVAVDYMESRRTFAHVVRLLMPRLPGLLLTRDGNGRIGDAYGADKGIPVMVMLHADGTVAYVHAGYDESELDTLIKEINMLLNESATQAGAK